MYSVSSAKIIGTLPQDWGYNSSHHHPYEPLNRNFIIYITVSFAVNSLRQSNNSRQPATDDE
jgi:hypothetical protein